jgi:glycosidase
MGFVDDQLSGARPQSVWQGVTLPRRESYFVSPADWRDEVLYFLLVDRFSDASESSRPLVDRSNLSAHRPGLPGGESWRWDRWAESGAHRWQGGNLQGVRSKLGYLQNLGVTTIWLSPVFTQRRRLDTYHGYGIQDFLDVDPRFGSRADLVSLIEDAHSKGIRVILDIIFNHSGANWVYPGGERTPGYRNYPEHYDFGNWFAEDGSEVGAIGGAGDGVWPVEFQTSDSYTRAGFGNLGAGSIDDENAEHKRTDFFELRDFNLQNSAVLNNIARCYKYWIALTDCDGFRIDTLKHVSLEEGRNFCGSVKEFAANLGKADFFLVGEVAGGDFEQDRYLDVLDRNLNAALDIGGMRPLLTSVGKGLQHPGDYFAGFNPGDLHMGSHRNLGMRHVSILDDHDHVFGEKVRFASEAAHPGQVVVPVALQLFSLGIPCVFYGTEQSLGGPEPEARSWLPSWKTGGFADRYLREAMFGPQHPVAAGIPDPTTLDTSLPGFGAFGTAGAHCFDENYPVFRQLSALMALRKAYPVLRVGRQYLRQTSFLGLPFSFYGPGEMLAWSRILDDEEAVCVANSHGLESRGGLCIVDAALNPPGSRLEVVLNTAEVESGGGYTGTHPKGERVDVKRDSAGAAYIEITDLNPSAVLVLSNYPE